MRVRQEVNAPVTDPDDESSGGVLIEGARLCEPQHGRNQNVIGPFFPFPTAKPLRSQTRASYLSTRLRPCQNNQPHAISFFFNAAEGRNERAALRFRGSTSNNSGF
jgi:hypothetical protein